MHPNARWGALRNRPYEFICTNWDRMLTGVRGVTGVAGVRGVRGVTPQRTHMI